jgi:hypothetical protein
LQEPKSEAAAGGIIELQELAQEQFLSAAGFGCDPQVKKIRRRRRRRLDLQGIVRWVVVLVRRHCSSQSYLQGRTRSAAKLTSA